jgi:hypothetical protein
MDAVRSCPNLQQLQAGGMTVLLSQFQQLQQLTSLTRLTLTTVDYTLRNKPFGLLTQLESLRLLGLRVYTAPGLYTVQDLTDDLQRLTALTRLSHLSMEVADRGTYATDAASPDNRCLSQFDHLRSVFDRMAATAELCKYPKDCIMWTYVSQVYMWEGACTDAMGLSLSICCMFRRVCFTCHMATLAEPPFCITRLNLTAELHGVPHANAVSCARGWHHQHVLVVPPPGQFQG